MHFYKVYRYTKFPKRLDSDKLIQKFDFLKDALEFSKNYNIQKDEHGRYIVGRDSGYYVKDVLEPSF